LFNKQAKTVFFELVFQWMNLESGIT